MGHHFIQDLKNKNPDGTLGGDRTAYQAFTQWWNETTELLRHNFPKVWKTLRHDVPQRRSSPEQISAFIARTLDVLEDLRAKREGGAK